MCPTIRDRTNDPESGFYMNVRLGTFYIHVRIIVTSMFDEEVFIRYRLVEGGPLRAKVVQYN